MTVVVSLLWWCSADCILSCASKAACCLLFTKTTMIMIKMMTPAMAPPVAPPIVPPLLLLPQQYHALEELQYLQHEVYNELQPLQPLQPQQLEYVSGQPPQQLQQLEQQQLVGLQLQDMSINKIILKLLSSFLGHFGSSTIEDQLNISAKRKFGDFFWRKVGLSDVSYIFSSCNLRHLIFYKKLLHGCPIWYGRCKTSLDELGYTLGVIGINKSY